MSGQRAAGTRAALRLADGLSPRHDPVARLHRFQGEHPEVQFTAPHMGGRGRYVARVPAGIIPGESREVTVSSMDLVGLMDQLDDYLPSGDGKLDQATRRGRTARGRPRRAAGVPLSARWPAATGHDVPSGAGSPRRHRCRVPGLRAADGRVRAPTVLGAGLAGWHVMNTDPPAL